MTWSYRDDMRDQGGIADSLVGQLPKHNLIKKPTGTNLWNAAREVAGRGMAQPVVGPAGAEGTPYGDATSELGRPGDPGWPASRTGQFDPMASAQAEAERQRASAAPPPLFAPRQEAGQRGMGPMNVADSVANQVVGRAAMARAQNDPNAGGALRDVARTAWQREAAQSGNPSGDSEAPEAYIQSWLGMLGANENPGLGDIYRRAEANAAQYAAQQAAVNAQNARGVGTANIQDAFGTSAAQLGRLTKPPREEVVTGQPVGTSRAPAGQPSMQTAGATPPAAPVGTPSRTANPNAATGVTQPQAARQGFAIDRSSPQAFLGSFVPAAQAALEARGLPASLAPALAAIPMNEQGWQKPAPGNNYYGIKGKNPRTGASAVSGTWEEEGGQRVNQSAEFRAYGDASESVDDFLQFLQDNPRYANALQVARQTGDPSAFVQAIHAAGYATDSQWPDKIRSIMRGVPNLAPAESPAVGATQQMAQTEPTAQQDPRLQRAAAGAPPASSAGVDPVAARTPGINLDEVFKRYQGGTYTWGGGRDTNGYGLPGTKATDCSGFVSAVMKEQGIDLPAQSGLAYSKLKQLGAAQVPPDQARAGDLVFYGDANGNIYHVGIYYGSGQVMDMAESQRPGGQNGVAIRNVTHAGTPIIMRDPRLGN